MTSPELLRAIGEALFGSRNESAELARLLGVGERSVRRWKSGNEEPPPGVWAELHTIASRRATDLRALILELERRR
jgi:hypothetical protein